MGRKQAIKLGVINKDRNFDVIFTSGLVRTIDSSNLAFPNYDKIIDNRHRKCNYGDYDGEDKKLVIYERHIDKPFPNGESLRYVEKRVRAFLDDVKIKYSGKMIAIVAPRAPQLAIEVITKNISWDTAISNDWRRTKDLKLGWKYIIENK